MRKKKTQKNILQIDGGGVLGRAAVSVLVELEAQLGKPLGEVFDLMSGSSTGAVIAALLACNVPASDVQHFYDTMIPNLFKKQALWRRSFSGQYDQRKFVAAAEAQFRNLEMGDTITSLMVTSVSLVDGRTHFFKSEGGKTIDDKKLLVKDVVAWSAFSAPYYFRPIPDEETGHVWTDGGTGGENCTLVECIIEAMRRNWYKTVNRIVLVSLGCGYEPDGMSFSKARKKSSLMSSTFFCNRARTQAIPEQLREYQVGWKKVLPMIRLVRLDFELKAAQNKIDAVKFLSLFARIGRELAKENVPKLLRLLK